MEKVPLRAAHAVVGADPVAPKVLREQRPPLPKEPNSVTCFRVEVHVHRDVSPRDCHDEGHSRATAEHHEVKNLDKAREVVMRGSMPTWSAPVRVSRVPLSLSQINRIARV